MDRQLLDDFRRLSAGKSPQRVEQETGGRISSSTAHRYRQGDGYPSRLSTDVREAMADYVERLGKSHDVPRETMIVREPAGEYATGGAAAIIRALGDPEWVRRQQGLLSNRDRAEMGYRIALIRQLPADEMAKIIEWRDELLRDEKDS